jgi:hypothetical protein
MFFNFELIILNRNFYNQILRVVVTNEDNAHNKKNVSIKQLSLIKAQPKKNASINKCIIWIHKALTTF